MSSTPAPKREFDRAGARRAHETTFLPVDAGVTDRAFGVVPNRELGERRGHDLSLPEIRDQHAKS
jgi:hypothetical protein